MNQRHKDIIKRLRAVTVGCREDMHEPDEQGVFARAIGTDLDNSFGSMIDASLIEKGAQEIVIVLDQYWEDNYGELGHTHDVFNLADLLAIVRNVDIEEDDK